MRCSQKSSILSKATMEEGSLLSSLTLRKVSKELKKGGCVESDLGSGTWIPYGLICSKLAQSAVRSPLLEMLGKG